MVLVPSLNSKLAVRKRIVLLEQRFGNQNHDMEIPEVLKEDSHLRIHLFGFVESAVYEAPTICLVLYQAT